MYTLDGIYLSVYTCVPSFWIRNMTCNIHVYIYNQAEIEVWL